MTAAASGGSAASSSSLSARLRSLVDESQVEEIIEQQRQALGRFEKTNEMLSNCCALSAGRLDAARRELLANTQLIADMKRDLDSVFRRIRLFKQTLSQNYPNEFRFEDAVQDEKQIASEATSSVEPAPPRPEDP